MEDWSKKEPRFCYMLLDRLRQDCEYYLRIGGSANCLWADSEKEQIQTMIDIWNKCSRPKDGPEVYQCKRMSSLFKDIYADGTVKYNDVNSSYCVSIHDSNNTYSSGLVRRIIDEMFPITMPYMPGRPIKVYCEDFLTDKKNGDFDTVGVFYALKTENGKQEKIEINRFFREPEGDEEGS